MSKKIASLILIALLLMLTACAAAKAAVVPDFQNTLVTATRAEAEIAPRTITVVGKGEVNLQPDIVTINVGAEARADTVAGAKDELEATMAAIIATLQQLEIAEKDFQTARYNIHHEREPQPRMPEGPMPEIREEYYVSNMVQVTIRDIELAGEVLDAFVQAGANQIYGITYTVSDESAWQSQARAQAVADARSRALELAELAGMALGDVLSVSEIVGGLPVPTIFRNEHTMGGGGIAPSELEITTQIQVTFAAG